MALSGHGGVRKYKDFENFLVKLYLRQMNVIL